MNIKSYVWLLMAVSLFLAGCTLVAAPKNITNKTQNPQLSCLDSCTGGSAPVCGSDNKTYKNACNAQCANATVAHEGECAPPPAAKTCYDTDGRDAYAKGTATISPDGASATDVCANNASVIEFTCSGASIVNETIPCREGFACMDGACTELPKPPECNDSDGGVNASVAGTVALGTESFSDKCNDVHLVKEYYCSNGAIANTLIQCPEGYRCDSGMCTQLLWTCTDSDGGNASKKGTVEKTSVMSQQKYADACHNSTSVTEYVCDGSNVTSSVIDCSSDEACSDGACVEASCSENDDGYDIYATGTVIKGELRYTDKCLGKNNGVEYYCDGTDVKDDPFTCPSGYHCDSGRCKVS